MDINVSTISTASSTARQNSTTTSADTAADFAGVLAAANGVANSSTTGTAKDAQFISGRIGLNLSASGYPNEVFYYGANGERLNASAFTPEDILANTKRFNIPLTDLRDLGSQLDTAGVGYKPYELYKGSGSDHGIDFEDLISGGLGTAYDWRVDPLAAAKGDYAVQHTADMQAFADSLGLVAHAGVTRGASAATTSTAAGTTTEATAGSTAESSSTGTAADANALSSFVRDSNSAATGTQTNSSSNDVELNDNLDPGQAIQAFLDSVQAALNYNTGNTTAIQNSASTINQAVNTAAANLSNSFSSAANAAQQALDQLINQVRNSNIENTSNQMS